MNNKPIDKYLNMIGYNLQLTEEKFQELQKNYQALSNYIANQHELADSEDYSIYQQGSFAIDTAIKPLKGDDFDVDVVVEFDMSKKDVGPIEFYNQLLNAFKEGKYGKLVEEYRNNIRINYNNNYHFDIMPAIPTPTCSESLNVPDRKKRDWVIRSPKTFAKWFIEQSKKVQGYKIRFQDNKYFMESITIPLKKPQPYEQKPTLNRVVQLIKRTRDIFFKDYEDCYPQSIVLTTLAAKYYNGEFSVCDAFTNIINKIYKLKESNKRFDVFNPSCNGYQENFTEKWKYKTKYYDNFSLYTDYLCENIEKLNKNDSVQIILKKMFGDSVIDSVYEQTKDDYFWKESNNISSHNVFPNSQIKIDKKERGNA